MGKIACEEAERLLSRYLDGELPAGEREQVEAHVLECSACRAALDAWSRIGVLSTDLLRQAIPRVPVRIEPPRRPSGRAWYWMAASAAALVLFAWILFALKPVREEPRIIASILSAVPGTTIVRKEAELPAADGMGLQAGSQIRTPSQGAASIRYPDGTRLDLKADTTAILEGTESGPKGPDAGKKLFLKQGILTAKVSRQPAGQPMILTTPQAEVTVVGTAFTVTVSAAETGVEMAEGSVQVRRLADDAGIALTAGQRATVAPGVELVAAPIAPADGTQAKEPERKDKDEQVVQGTVILACPQGTLLKLKTGGGEMTFGVVAEAREQVKALRKGDAAEVSYVKRPRTNELVVLSARKLPRAAADPRDAF